MLQSKKIYPMLILMQQMMKLLWPAIMRQQIIYKKSTSILQYDNRREWNVRLSGGEKAKSFHC